MCEWRDNDPNNSGAGRTKVSDCGKCDCGESDEQHNYYHGKCTGCGKDQ